MQYGEDGEDWVTADFTYRFEFDDDLALTATVAQHARPRSAAGAGRVRLRPVHGQPARPHVRSRREEIVLMRWSGLIAIACIAACGRPSTPPAETTTPGAVRSSTTGAAPAPNPLRNVYFGDLHLHTRNSFDAYIFNVRATPDDAYAYAKGGTIKHAMGFDLHLNHGPLDFLAVTDHAEYLGVLPAIDTPGSEYSKVPYAKELFATDRAGVIAAFRRFADRLDSGKRMPELSDLSAPCQRGRKPFAAPSATTSRASSPPSSAMNSPPCPKSATCIAMSSSAGSKAPALPYSALESQNPEDLWRWLDQRRAEGIEALAIPHNANGSDGTMFERTMWNGQPIDRA